MKQRRWGLILWLVAMLVACSGPAGTTSTPIATLPIGEAMAGSILSGGVTASGTVAPVQETQMSFTLTGRVQTVNVAVGDAVQPGTVLATLETAALEAQVAQAEAGLEAAQAQLMLVQAGPRPAEIAAAQAQVDAANAGISQATAQRDQLDAGTIEAEIASAQAQVAAAQSQQRQAQDAHDQAIKCYDLPDGGNICPLLGTAEEQARYALNAANEALTAAQAQLDALTSSAADKKRGANAAVAAAVAQRDTAQAQLDLLQSGSKAEEVATAEAAVREAEAALQATRVAFEQAELRAPFGATVTACEIHPGETVLPGELALTLADLSQLQVKTTDLSELDVNNVAVGQRVNLHVEALGADSTGRVVRIAPQASTVGGDVVYEVVIELDNQPAGLRWGMSVDVEIVAE